MAHDEHTQFWQKNATAGDVCKTDMEGFHFVLENTSRVARSHERLTTIFRTEPELLASRTSDAGTAGKQIGERIGRPGGFSVGELHFRKRTIIGDEVAP
ncbi:hypothetical protein D7Y44_19685 [Stenotrophomonas maltophilia]|nr:hypothetical protein [Stenotrophomonas maltophilia]MBA0346601.1 hypothetical protein [Stenotrophomonas maltophilia]MBA0359645.1 hypothetical protein [Stenotrophomonas maltophilia]MBA0519069.1 hypothetical protein [Stenotrophomonas maltophilia]